VTSITTRGHASEIVCVGFNPPGRAVATGSMDSTARLWDVESGDCLHTLLGHSGSLNTFSNHYSM